MQTTDNNTVSPINRQVDIDAERAVLGSCLIDPSAIVRVAGLLVANDFYKSAHQRIFSAMLALTDTQTPIDVTTLAAQLVRVNALDDAGGYHGITELFMNTPTALYAEHYAHIVAEKATLRRLTAAAQEIATVAYEAEDAESAVDAAEAALLKVTAEKRQTNMEAVGNIMRQLIDRLSMQQDGSVTGIPTGFRMMDMLLGGLQKSDLIIMAGRPGMGKSSLALTIADNAARKYDQRVAIFSLEMSKEQLVERITSMRTGIASNQLRLGKLNNDDWVAVMEVANELLTTTITIDDQSGVTVDYVRREARRLHAEQGLDLIVIDYMQLMSGSNTSRKADSENRQQEISYISRSLKAMAKELNVPVIALSQLSRAVEARADKKPMLSDLRESGSIEQDADVVLFIYREDYYIEDTDRQNIADVIVAKHRHGATGTFSLFFRKELTQFRDLEMQRTEL